MELLQTIDRLSKELLMEKFLLKHKLDKLRMGKMNNYCCECNNLSLILFFVMELFFCENNKNSKNTFLKEKMIILRNKKLRSLFS